MLKANEISKAVMKTAMVAALVAFGALVSGSVSAAPPASALDHASHASPIAAGASASGNNYKVVGTADACLASADVCVIKIQLDATGDYHINETYPYKFTVEKNDKVKFLSKDKKDNVFSKAAGDFKNPSPKTGIMEIRFKPLAKGAQTVSGKFNMSVCSASTCQLEQPELSIPVNVN